MHADLVATIPCQCILGEGILWDHRLGLFLWTDIEGKALHSYHLESRAHGVLPLGRRLAALALTPDPTRLLAAFDDRIALLDRTSGAVRDRLVPALTPGTRFNDGKTAPDGSFWVGTMVEDAAAAGGPDAGILYQYTADGRLLPRRHGIAISNGLAWRPDGTGFHFADSPRQTIWHIGEDTEAGTPFATTGAGAYPDGATFTADGRYISALWGGGRLAVLAGDGAPAGEIMVPATQPSCCAFGGPDLSLLAVSSARQGLSDAELSADPGAGHVFLYQTDTRGLPSVPYAGPAD